MINKNARSSSAFSQLYFSQSSVVYLSIYFCLSVSVGIIGVKWSTKSPIEGVSHRTVIALMSELGSEGFKKFPTHKNFTWWL